MSQKKCGTYAGWNAHQKRGKRPCGPCSDAQNLYMRIYRIRNGLTTQQAVPVEVLRSILLGTNGRSALRAYFGAEVADAIVESLPKASGEAA